MTSATNASPYYKGKQHIDKLLDEGGIIKIKAMNIIFVVDSYDTDCIQRMDYFSAVL
jgi:hypothetical protein